MNIQIKPEHMPSDKLFIRSPLNYIGGKYKLLNQIVPLFPTNIQNFVDLFAGGFNVGINIKAKKIYLNDNLTYLIDMYKSFMDMPLTKILTHINKRISRFNLNLKNADGYYNLRSLYNQKQYPLDLFVLTAYSFNHQIRFNSKHEFNNPFGKNRSSFNNRMRANLIDFINKLKSSNIIFSKKDFDKFNFSKLGNNDLVYCDPPYLITTGTYNDGKRGFKGWSNSEEIKLLKLLEDFNKNKIKFALSNVIQHGNKKNDILISWLANNNFCIHNIDSNYSNSNYHIAGKKSKISSEVLITNYTL